MAENYTTTNSVVLSPTQWQDIFDNNIRRFVRGRNYNPATVEKYGSWSYDKGILADGSDRHYIQRIGGFVRNQDGERACCTDVDYASLRARIRDGEFYDYLNRLVAVPLKDGSELICFGLGGSE